MTGTEPDKLAERVGKIRDRVTRILAVASPSPALTRANEGAYAALETLLAAHSPTALVRHAEPCADHRYSPAGARRDCPDCVLTERAGCDRCRDEYGNPARPEDCEVRKTIAGSLTRTVDTGEIDTATRPPADKDCTDEKGPRSVQGTAFDGIGWVVGPVHSPAAARKLRSELAAAGWAPDRIVRHYSAGAFRAEAAGS